MTLKERFYNEIKNMKLKERFYNLIKYMERAEECEKIADDYAIEFAEWKDDNFSMYKDKTYYPNTSSQYFDITKYIGKEKPTKYYTVKELLEIFKKEKGL